MFRITIKNIIRSFVKHLNISLINLVGLVLAFTVFIFIVQYVLYEKSFDQFWSGSDQIYRVSTVCTRNGDIVYDGAKSPRGIWFAKEEIPEVEACGYAFYESCQIRRAPYALFEQNVLWVSADFQEVFNFEMKSGVSDFDKTHTAIISEDKARVLFGNENPIGQIIKVNEGMPIEITGVFKDLPANTHLKADYFISSLTWVDYGWISANGEWNWNGWWTYFKLKKGSNPANVDRKLAELVNVNLPGQDEENKTTTFSLQALSNIHFDGSKQGDFGLKMNKVSLLNLFLFGVFVLLVAWINYINLSIALAIKKEKSIGIQKLVGANSVQQMLYVILDSLLLNLLAALISWLLYWVLSPLFTELFHIPIGQSFIPKGLLIGGFITAMLIGIVLSSGYSLLSILKINPFVRKTKIKDGVFQRGLIIAQLCITVMFISLSVMIYRQLDFVQHYNLGMNLDQVLVLSAPTSYNGQVNPQRVENPKFDRFTAFREKLVKNTAIRQATAVSGLPGAEMGAINVRYIRPNAEVMANDKFSRMDVDNGFLETFGLELVAGDPLPASKNSYGKVALINEQAMTDLGFSSADEAIGQILLRDNYQLKICGVVKDFHFEGLQKSIYPIVFEFMHPTEFGYYPIKVNTNNISSLMTYIEQTWKEYYPNDPFNCFFQDEFYNNQYQAFERIAKFNIVFALLSVVISCLGLYGIILFYIARRTKEIGVRKVNGAPVFHILYLLNRNVIIWFVIAIVVAAPLTFLIIQKWLENFAYKTDISYWIFVLSGFVALFLALVTVSVQSWRAATRNPVEALRYE